MGVGAGRAAEGSEVLACEAAVADSWVLVCGGAEGGFAGEHAEAGLEGCDLGYAVVGWDVVYCDSIDSALATMIVCGECIVEYTLRSERDPH